MTEHIAAGQFSLDAVTRTVRGLLLPWGELSRPNLNGVDPIEFPRGTVAVPSDITVLNANRHHNQFDPVARFVSIEDTERGLVASFAIANSAEGDELIRDYQAGKITKLSAEIRDIVRAGAKGISAMLSGAAFVTEGAFASAALFAIGDITLATDTPTDPAIVSVPIVAPAPLQVADDGSLTVTTDTTPDVVNIHAADSDTPVSFTPAPITPEGDPVTAASVPATMAAAAAPKAPGMADVFELVTQSRAGMPSADTMLAALSDIKISGAGALPVAGVLQPAWLGEVWAEKTYVRRYMNLIRQGNIIALDEKGFNLETGAELVQTWAGNKAALPSGNSASTNLLSSVFQRWGYAADIAREFYDIPAGRPVVEAFIRAIANSYARVTDKWTLQQMVAAAGAQIDAETYPDTYNAALGKVIQAIDTVDDTDVDASFVIVAKDVYKQLRYTPKDLIPEYVTFSFGSTEGAGEGVVVVRDKSGTLAPGQVLAGGHDAAHVNELPGASPMNLDALDIANGGIDKAAVGYTQFMAEYSDGLVLIGDEAP